MAKVVMTFEDKPDGKTEFKVTPTAEQLLSKSRSGEEMTNAEYMAMVAGNAVLFKLKEIRESNNRSVQTFMGEINNEISAKEAEIVKQLHRKGKI